jgi:hypothetical protein
MVDSKSIFLDVKNNTLIFSSEYLLEKNTVEEKINFIVDNIHYDYTNTIIKNKYSLRKLSEKELDNQLISFFDIVSASNYEDCPY